MQFLALIVTLATMRFATAEPAPADMGSFAAQPLVVRNMLMHPRAAVVSCCDNKFSGNCDCGDCPIAECAVSILIHQYNLESATNTPSGKVRRKRLQMSKR
ncbi:hypothetical protein PspLS_10523 [Pyricularia sp. CBS 133598]|nr:hypothetical protein PspLS_10523 [Pyricularia sp. CBS 133598]